MSNKTAVEVFSDLHKKYGPVYSLKFANRDVIMLNTVEVVKEALLKKAVEFAGRPAIYSVEIFTEGYKDIVFSNYGPQWRYQRKLGHTALRHFAKKEQLEKLVYSVTPEIAKVLDGLGDKPFAPKYTIGQIVYNILASMCFGRQYEFNQPELLQWIDLNVEAQKAFGNGLLPDYFPALSFIPTQSEKKVCKIVGAMLDVFYGELKRHREQFDPDNVRDFFDSLLLTQKQAIEAGEEEADKITDTHIVQTVSDIFGAGTETTIITLHWAVGLMVENPDIQQKVAMEIDEVLGRDRLPSLDDRASLPYTEATILEIFRYGTVAPTGLPHAVMEDTTLAGYDIPKGTTVMIDILALHNDTKEWNEPEKFKPERFLDDNGQLLSKLPESFLPFSAGRRVCLGEDFAKKEIFLLFTWLFSRYTFYKVPGKESESVLTLNRVAALTHQPIDEMEVCVKKQY
ncbi:steroid 17-alpha-hydroxylase/17,20 lyase-like isoform X2 [Acanthaster planci]|nr:steroid 17-alpha-hydroxylase/17,20 lyase-like isoform X2 [Acanthaster planci]XP_022111400.1 steroid 17-alpha-hydroxylase/17,20 lyase-like isoform X2 [Acanthaster planci]